ncbi:MAG: GtrA family protein [Candidatus Parvarchaeota archaeon]|nr:GtrA family protein [Candidatus Parvarchaeota archaeon]MCW1294525.1 GtrA family protein [Candidatus Parvarchaeum tengchongense]MCW1296021.1 GtrA family protein [Candidatus Parvarchaeum tengchongense]MCW1311899.1 GtrA family protein [Candidatus Parvarchaeum tengchongense]
MNSPSVAFLLPAFVSQKTAQRRQFLDRLNAAVNQQSIVLLDSTEEDEDKWKNLVIVRFAHTRLFGESFRLGLSAALNLGAEKIVTFEDYSKENAAWFTDYLNGGNLIESGKRNFREMLVTEISNLLSFGNSYNNFSFNRILTKEAALLLRDTKLNGKSFLVESINVLNAHGIHTTEIIREEYGKDNKRINLAEMGESIIRSFNRTSINYSLISSLSYIVNLFMVYTSLSLGFFYPLAVLLGGEISGLSNFIVNEKINFRNKGFLSSAYRFGKFNAFILAVVAFDIFMISVISKYMLTLGRTDFSILSTFSIVIVSAVSLFFTNKFIWGKGNHQKVFL